MHLQYIEAFLVSTLPGALPQTPASLAAPQGQAVKTQPPDPVAKCWVGSKASRVKMHGFAALDPLSTSVRVAKRSEADGAGNLSRLAKQPLAAWPLQVEATQRSVVRVQEVFPLHPCHVANAGVGSAHGVGKTLGGRAVGGQCAVGTHFKGFGG